LLVAGIGGTTMWVVLLIIAYCCLCLLVFKILQFVFNIKGNFWYWREEGVPSIVVYIAKGEVLFVQQRNL
jgi:hypothetical protein